MCEKGLVHVDWVNFDQINSVVMEEWHSWWDSAVLEGDGLHGGSDLIEWGQG